MGTLPRYRRKPINPIGAETKRKMPARRLAYAAVTKRAKGACEMPGCTRRQDPLDPHHTYRRGRLPGIPAEFCDTPELILGVCRPCHDRLEVDAAYSDVARWLAFDLFLPRHDLAHFDFTQFTDPLDAMRGAVRLLEEREAC